jgi:hypothetical protein
MKIEVFIQIGKALLALHRNRESYGDLKDTNVIVNSERQILLSCIIDKNVPPHVYIFLNRLIPSIMTAGNFSFSYTKHSPK